MDLSNLLIFASVREGQGWTGIMEIIEAIGGCRDISFSEDEFIKEKLQQVLGELLLSGEYGCDEMAIKLACDQCILVAIQTLEVWIFMPEYFG